MNPCKSIRHLSRYASRFCLGLSVSLLAITVSAQTTTQSETSPNPTPQVQTPPAPAQKTIKVQMKTSMGNITLELYPESAPKTVDNFLHYVKKGQYNKTIFHRVIDNFMIQGGGMDAKMNEKPTDKPIPSEAALALKWGLKNDLGTIAMARMSDPNSARAQFYINVNVNEFLDHQELPPGDPVQINKNGETVTLPRIQALNATAGYTPFGRVIEGWDVVEKIKVVPTDVMSIHKNVPIKPITILTMKVIK